MGLFQKVLAILAIVIPLCQNIHASTCDSISLALMEQTWREFRDIHPFGFQTVGLKHYGDTCVFVISEPAEWVKREELGALFSEYNGHLIVGRHPFGLDGALYDAVGCVKLNATNFHSFEEKLFTFLYGECYKPYYTDLNTPVKHVYFSDTKLNFPISTIDWDGWINTERFSLPNGSFLSIDSLDVASHETSNELYFSKERGFVAWRIDKEALMLSDMLFRHNARRFTLDSDFVVHSIEKDNSVFIIGRERELPVTVLPPLRVETICQLARLAKQKLSVFISPEHAECIEDSTIWITPIKISRDLQDTGLGNLFTLTDILLKSWSENAQIVDSFINYPNPESFTCNGVAQELGYSPKYEWAFYSGVTGSLPPLYRADTDSITNMELCIQLHKYFANLNNTDLVRTVQYSQIHKALLPLRKANQSYFMLDDSLVSSEPFWIKTPSITVSNNTWGCGGYMLQVPIVRTTPKVLLSISKRGFKIPSGLLTGRLPVSPPLTTAVQRESFAYQRLMSAKTPTEKIKAQVVYNSAKRNLEKELKRYDSARSLPQPPDLSPSSNNRNPRKILVTPNIGYDKRGYDSKNHNIIPSDEGQNKAIDGQRRSISRLREKLIPLIQNHRIGKESEIDIICFMLTPKNYYGETYYTLAA